MPRLTFAALISTLASACAVPGPLVEPPPPSIAEDGGASDAGPSPVHADAGWSDDGGLASGEDAGPSGDGVDAGVRMIGWQDAGSVDAGSVDAGPLDAGSSDAGAPLGGCQFDADGELLIPDIAAHEVVPHGDGLTIVGTDFGESGMELLHLNPSDGFSESWRSSWEHIRVIGGRPGTDELLFATHPRRVTSSTVVTAVDVDPQGISHVRGVIPDALSESSVQQPDGQLAAVAEENGQLFARRRDPTLSVAMQAEVTGGHDYYTRGWLSLMPDGGLVHTGRATDSHPTGSQLFASVIRTQADGSVLWRYSERANTAGAPSDILLLSDGSVVVVGKQIHVAGGAWAMRLDDQGALLWNVLIPTGANNASAQAVRDLGAGRLLVVVETLRSQTSSTGRRTSEIVLLDSATGAVLSTDSIGNGTPFDRTPRSVATWTDGSGSRRFAIVGSTHTVGTNSGHFRSGFLHSGVCSAP